jgi:hypothetical protein
MQKSRKRRNLKMTSKFTEAKKRVVMEIGIGVLPIEDDVDFDYYKTIVEALEIAERCESAMDVVNRINAIPEKSV